MAKHSKNKRKEKQEIAILNLLLNSNPLRTELTSGEDDVPLIDGYVHLLVENDEVGGSMLKVQVKPLKTNKGGNVTATCGIDLLNHAHSSSLPLEVSYSKAFGILSDFSPIWNKSSEPANVGSSTAQMEDLDTQKLTLLRG